MAYFQIFSAHSDIMCVAWVNANHMEKINAKQIYLGLHMLLR